MRLLIVDDDPTGARALATLLNMDGFDVVELHSPEKALERLRTEQFDAVITDLEMPVMHGLDLLRALKSCAPMTPVFVVTGYTESPVSREALTLGARRVFGKPIAYEDLCGELKQLPLH